MVDIAEAAKAADVEVAAAQAEPSKPTEGGTSTGGQTQAPITLQQARANPQSVALNQMADEFFGTEKGTAHSLWWGESAIATLGEATGTEVKPSHWFMGTTVVMAIAGYIRKRKKEAEEKAGPQDPKAANATTPAAGPRMEGAAESKSALLEGFP